MVGTKREREGDYDLESESESESAVGKLLVGWLLKGEILWVGEMDGMADDTDRDGYTVRETFRILHE